MNVNDKNAWFGGIGRHSGIHTYTHTGTHAYTQIYIIYIYMYIYIYIYIYIWYWEASQVPTANADFTKTRSGFSGSIVAYPSLVKYSEN